MAIKRSTRSWVARRGPREASRVRLFCIPYEGAGPSVFRTWPDELPAWVDICAVQLPGREDRLRERAFDRLGPLVAELAAALGPLLDLPFTLFGHGVGALIGFELARELRRAGQPGPVGLFVSGRRAPQLADPNPPLHGLGDAALVAELERRGGIAAQVVRDAELLRVTLATLRADLALGETYQYQPEEPLACGIWAFGGHLDAEVSTRDLGAWSEQTRGCFAVHLLPGDHFFLHSSRAPLLYRLAEALEQVAGARVNGEEKNGTIG